ncbi:aldehyde reductase [Aquimarina sp. BL5]|uniref:SDR family oxidoreductase n=1 Tax=Aquimarina sp. BL5 TaxID=1714860 RepID=UPI000E51FA71|nr:aldehyde reductase [Aquimarina sp. BL5]AXT50759.1 aldehyde reductase [Aquimarina sp. BL5]RKN08218.1 NAD-dependent epimerase/dehydratase family protein [Aquimarina sp. BL5]
MENKKVLLTGVTGFLGSHTAIQLLNKGYEVIGTLRNMKRANEIKQVIAKNTSNIDRLDLAEANLMDENIWSDLASEVQNIIHIASPFPRELPKNENDLIIPAKTGTLNILKAASIHGLRRVVLTSSSGAIVYGKEKSKRKGIFDENDWTDITNIKDSTPYFRSKTIAEKAAWDFIENDKSGLELTTICPGAILGPILEKDFGTSANIVIKAMDGSSPAIPKIGFDMVDVRSVADLHIRAMEVPEAAGERFVGSAGFLTFEEVASIIRKKYPNKKVPKFSLPNFAVRLFSNLDKTIKPILIDLGAERRVNNNKAIKLLDWQPISTKEAVLACAESAIKLSLV